jgi:hypothetical protein
MPKKYFCENLIELEPCGEEDPDKFSPGRYNRCRKCRNLDNKKYMQHLKELTVREKMEERTQELKDGKKIQLLIEAIITGKSFNDEGTTIPEDSWFMKDKINLVSRTSHELFSKVDEENKKIKLKNTYIEEEIKKLKEENLYFREKSEKNELEISKMKIILEEKLNFKFN